MKILVANLGSTSFKYRLFDMADERVLARGGVERIGSDNARCYVEAGKLRDEATLATLAGIGALVYGGVVIALFGPQWLAAFRRRR